MKKLYIGLLSFLIMLIVADTVDAHVSLDSPEGGETFVSGATVIIKWTILIEHPQNNWDLYFSSNGGTDWEEIKLDIDPSQLFYAWTVPEITTENARIKIIQDNMGGNYGDICSDFTITDVQTSIGIQENNPSVFNCPTTII